MVRFRSAAAFMAALVLLFSGACAEDGVSYSMEMEDISIEELIPGIASDDDVTFAGAAEDPAEDGVFIEVDDAVEGWLPLFGANARGDFVGMPTCWPSDARSDPVGEGENIIRLDIDLLLQKKTFAEVKQIAGRAGRYGNGVNNRSKGRQLGLCYVTISHDAGGFQAECFHRL